MSGSKFKYATQLYESNQLLYTAMLQKSLSDNAYEPTAGKKFLISERGKTRFITSNTTVDKTVNHVLCDEILTPYLKKYLIYDNGASQKGKGVDFHRRRFAAHLHKYFMKHG
ncbi:MAG: Reverse transcriptase (RNA-dependent DNA polymerase), partial [Ruminococcus sp.]|nr:Reverse transcriptase (RNA-dependent DNA polymerase) [Ruminococcus sp.]